MIPIRIRVRVRVRVQSSEYIILFLSSCGLCLCFNVSLHHFSCQIRFHFILSVKQTKGEWISPELDKNGNPPDMVAIGLQVTLCRTNEQYSSYSSFANLYV